MIQLNTQLIGKQQKLVRDHFTPIDSPFHFISYSSFNRHFEANAQKNFKHENLNIIDLHLKYRQYIREQMAPFKWIPTCAITSYYLLRFKMRLPLLIFPCIYVALFDYYFQPFFCWLYKDQKIINMRNQFVTKLSKPKNKNRRVKLWKQLQKQLKWQDQLSLSKEKKPQIPYKYLKFGCPTQYISHSKINNIQMSTILQTKLFQTYMGLKNLNMKTFQHLYSYLLHMAIKFKQYRKVQDKKQCYMYFLSYGRNIKKLLLFKDIKQWQKYNISMNIQNRIRRFIEISAYVKNGSIYFSGFTLDKVFYMYKHHDVIEPAKYNIQSNLPDLTIYYSAIIIPFILQKIIKR